MVFPNNLLHFEVGRDKSIAAVEWAVRNKSEVFLIAQKDMKAEDPKAEEMYQYGVVAEIKQVMRVSDDLVRILVEGKFRAKRTELDTEGSFLLASVRPAPVRPIKAEEETEAEALLRNVKTSFDAVLSMNPRISKDVVFAVTSNNDPAFLCEYIPANLLFRFEDKQAVMEESTSSAVCACWWNACIGSAGCWRSTRKSPRKWTRPWIRTSVITTCMSRCT